MRKVLLGDLPDFEIFSLTKLYGVFEQEAFQGVKILYFKIAINQDAFDFKIIGIAKIDQSVFFSYPQYIEG